MSEDQLFSVEKAAKAWNGLCGKYSHRRKKDFTAWDRLSYHMRHSFSPVYDGGLLRVIAFFGASMPDDLRADAVIFQPGPMTASIGADPFSPDPAQRYLLLHMARLFSESTHLREYIKEYTNAYHRKSKSPDAPTMFNRLHELLASELADAVRRDDYNARRELNDLAGMLRALGRMEF